MPWSFESIQGLKEWADQEAERHRAAQQSYSAEGASKSDKRRAEAEGYSAVCFEYMSMALRDSDLMRMVLFDPRNLEDAIARVEKFRSIVKEQYDTLGKILVQLDLDCQNLRDLRHRNEV